MFYPVHGIKKGSMFLYLMGLPAWLVFEVYPVEYLF